MASSGLNRVNATSLLLDPQVDNPTISEDLNQTFARLMVWDVSNQLWVQASADVQGRLLTSGLSPNVPILNIVNVSVINVEQLLFQANPNRNGIFIYARKANAFVIGFIVNIFATGFIPVGNGQTVRIDAYNGPIYCRGSNSVPSNIYGVEY